MRDTSRRVPMSGSALAYAFLFVVVVGIQGVALKLALRELDWQMVTAWVAFIHLLLVIVIWYRGDLDLRGPYRGTIIAICSGTVAATALPLLNIALERGDASLVVPVAAGYPAVTTVLAILFLRERMTWSRLLGLMFVLLGLILIGLDA